MKSNEGSKCKLDFGTGRCVQLRKDMWADISQVLTEPPNSLRHQLRVVHNNRAAVEIRKHRVSVFLGCLVFHDEARSEG